MHPVEHLIFFTSCCLPLFYELHPIHMLFPCLYARISPIAGHDGFDKVSLPLTLCRSLSLTLSLSWFFSLPL